MVNHLLRLRFHALGNILRRTPWNVLLLILGIAYTGVLTAAGIVLLATSRSWEPEAATAVPVVVGAAILLLALLAPIIAGPDDMLDVRAFRVFPVTPAALARGLVIATVLGVPSLAFLLYLLSFALTWATGPLPAVAAVLSALIALGLWLLSIRVGSTLSALLFTRRRTRDLRSVSGAVLLCLSLIPIIVITQIDWHSHGESILNRVAEFLSWSPWGAVWELPSLVLRGQYAEAGGKAGIAVAGLLLLAAVWHLLVARLLRTVEEPTEVQHGEGAGWFQRLPQTPRWVMAARSLTYWWRDERYRATMLVIPLVPLVVILPLAVAGVPSHYLSLFPVPVIALFIAWSVHNDIAHDNTALWIQVAAGVSGEDDRFARLFPALLAGVPVVLAGSLLSAWGFGEPAVMPSVLGVSACILLFGLGFSSITSVLSPYPVVAPGESPFVHPQTVGSGAAVVQTLSFLAVVLAALPAGVLAGFGLATGLWYWHLAAGVVGIAVGVAGLLIGTRISARYYNRRVLELLEFQIQN